ncbi:helix-turn-helix domain-containing protein [Patescibacteria group bacterium]|nr:helix-turn-helix domain-containing protein [Patescibacteria group bacterium]
MQSVEFERIINRFHNIQEAPHLDPCYQEWLHEIGLMSRAANSAEIGSLAEQSIHLSDRSQELRIKDALVLLLGKHAGYLVSKDRLVVSCSRGDVSRNARCAVSLYICKINRGHELPTAIFSKTRIGYGLGVQGLDLDLTEMKILYRLWQSPGIKVSKRDFRQHIWPTWGIEEIDDSLRVYASKLRKHLSKSSYRIETISDASSVQNGYRLIKDDFAFVPDYHPDGHLTGVTS